MPAAEVHPVLVRRTVTGLPAAVRAVLEHVHGEGRLVEMTPPRPVDTRRVRVEVLLREPPTQRAAQPAQRLAAARPRRRGAWLPAGAVVLVVAVLAAAGVALVWLVHWLAAHRAVILGGLAVLAILAVVLSRTAGVCCPGLHCPGCGHR